MLAPHIQNPVALFTKLLVVSHCVLKRNICHEHNVHESNRPVSQQGCARAGSHSQFEELGCKITKIIETEISVRKDSL